MNPREPDDNPCDANKVYAIRADSSNPAKPFLYRQADDDEWTPNPNQATRYCEICYHEAVSELFTLNECGASYPENPHPYARYMIVEVKL